MITGLVPQIFRQPDTKQRISPHFLKVRTIFTQKDAGARSLYLSRQWLLMLPLSFFRLEHNATWSAQPLHRKALRLSLMKQSWPFSTPRRRRSTVQSAIDAAPLYEVTWKEKWDEFNENKQVRKAMKVISNWKGEHDQKGVLFTQIGALHSVKPPSCITIGQLLSMCNPNLQSYMQPVPTTADCAEPTETRMPAPAWFFFTLGIRRRHCVGKKKINK